MNNWLNIIQNKLLPPRCILCENPGFDSKDLCLPCYHDLRRNVHCCYRCAEPFEIAPSTPQLCGRCISNAPAFEETHAPFLFTDRMRHLITELKFGHRYRNARLLGQLLAEELGQNVEHPQCIIPMPLHRLRYCERGFNQSLEIARHVSRMLDVPVVLNACERKRNNPHQAGLSARQRRKNIVGAFQASSALSYQHVAILDDVMTTGSTVNALATTLKKAGVERIDVWVCARA